MSQHTCLRGFVQPGAVGNHEGDVDTCRTLTEEKLGPKSPIEEQSEILSVKPEPLEQFTEHQLREPPSRSFISSAKINPARLAAWLIQSDAVVQ